MLVIIVVTGFLLDNVLFDSSAWDGPRPITTNIANIDTLLAIALFFFFTSLVSSVSVSVFLIKKRLCCLEWFR